MKEGTLHLPAINVNDSVTKQNLTINIVKKVVDALSCN
jgi:S-adenosylhomocysteine hydrolase